MIENIAREYFDYKIFLYFDPTLKETPKTISSFLNAYNNVFIKENIFYFDKFLNTSFSRHSKLPHGILTRLRTIISSGSHVVDKQLVPFIDLWQNGGYYFSVNVTLGNIESANSISELFNFYCEQILIDKDQVEKHKVCKINFLKVGQLDCIVELAIKNYLLYFEKGKTYNFNRMFMNLFNNQNKILSKNNKVSQNQYLTCFKSKLKGKKVSNSLDFLFKFTDKISNSFVKTTEENCPITNSMITV